MADRSLRTTTSRSPAGTWGWDAAPDCGARDEARRWGARDALRAYRGVALALPAAVVDQLLARTVRLHGLRFASWLILSGVGLAARGVPAGERGARRARAAAALRAAITRERQAGILPEVIAGRLLTRASRAALPAVSEESRSGGAVRRAGPYRSLATTAA